MLAPFTWNIRVYYEDTDAGGIVFYANYLKYFERARTEWLRAADVHQHDLAIDQKIMFVVKSSALEYHAPARMDDALKLNTTVVKLGQASLHFLQEIWCGSQLLTTARIKVGCVNTETIRPCAIPTKILKKIQVAHSLLT